MSQDSAIEQKQICTFTVDGLLFGIDVTQVQEVIRYQEMTPVPLSNTVVAGLINLRGQIVTAFDMRRRLGLTDRGPNDVCMNVVVRRADGPISLLVDEIGDVIAVDSSFFEPPPDTLSERAREMVSGVYKLRERLLLLLNTEVATQH